MNTPFLLVVMLNHLVLWPQMGPLYQRLITHGSEAWQDNTADEHWQGRQSNLPLSYVSRTGRSAVSCWWLSAELRHQQAAKLSSFLCVPSGLRHREVLWTHINISEEDAASIFAVEAFTITKQLSCKRILRRPVLLTRMLRAGAFETFVTSYKITRRYIPGHRNYYGTYGWKQLVTPNVWWVRTKIHGGIFQRTAVFITILWNVYKIYFHLCYISILEATFDCISFV
jgi:hypothetical protein